MYRRALAAVVLLVLSVFFGCTDIFGVETDYLDNPCLAPGAASLPPLDCGIGACRQLAPACVDDLPAKCPAVAAGIEICNGLDDDCNGAVDDTCPCTGTATNSCYPGSAATRNIGACQDGVQACLGTLWGPCDGAVVPKADTCNGLDDDCNGKVDDDCPCNPGIPQPCYDGPIATRGVGVCKDGMLACDDDTVGDCQGAVTPGTETCNGLDDDCNGTVDDGCPCAPDETQDCYTGPDGTLDVGECAGGTQTCDKGAWAPCQGDVIPVDEICNKKDDNCDGEVDEGNPDGGDACDTGNLGVCAAGVITCTSGQALCKQTLMPSPETCNGADDDCDGEVDEGDPGGGLACPTGFPGSCATGTLACLEGTVKCIPNGQSAEVCDNIDNDCDGVVDNGLGVGSPCAEGIGACQTSGVFVCAAGGQIVCNAVPGAPAGEVCDGIDNNCDGTKDEGNPGSGLACNTGFPGTCALGTTACQNGVVACTPVNTNPEVCDGIDNDCDGVADNGLGLGLPCSSGVGACTQGGVFVCGAGGAVVCNATPGAPSGELCDSVDNDCDGATDEGNPGGDAGCVTGLPGACSTGKTSCLNGALQCLPQAVATEICDGVDNDCNGILDDGFGVGTPCTNGVGACQKVGVHVCAANGTAVCNAVPGAASGEVCDGLDNNCNGTTDEGNPGGGAGCMTGLAGACAAGTTTCLNGALKCVATASGAEVCDGVDNDCDGTVDDGFGLGTPCLGGVGACQTAGVVVCKADGTAFCNAVPGAPAAEVCDGVDNNCNMTTDEGNPGGGLACSTGFPGACATGTTKCSGGVIACTPVNAGPTEQCDGVDNDCNGQIDDGLGLGLPCFSTGLGACMKAGVKVCGLAGAVACNAVDGVPTGEVCDGVDNNCNGTIDEGNPGGGTGCATGLPGTCAQGKQTCQNGAFACVPASVGLEVCDGVDNNCNGIIDDGYGVGTACSEGTGACAVAGVMACNAAEQAACNAVAGQPTGEVCDGADNNCNGTIDDGDPGGGVGCMTGFPGACAVGTTTCLNGAVQCLASNADTEVCDGADNDCDGLVDEGLGLGLPCFAGDGACEKPGVRVCGANGQTACNAVAGAPSGEVCDGVDNDCDGAIDDGNPGSGGGCMTGLPGACAVGIMECQSGALTCVANNASVSEVCDGVDNDCDGVADNGLSLGNACLSKPGVGACQKAGVKVCGAGGQVICNAMDGPPSGEVCDGVDNDCDGLTDENTPGAGVGCMTGFPGTCAVGTTQCLNGAIQCKANNAAPTEVCNGVDDDCDGAVDNGLGLGSPCDTPGEQGECYKTGVYVCGPGTPVCSVLPGVPAAELCDGLDNDCDGTIDNGNPGSGQACTSNGAGACSAGTTTCTSGQIVCMAKLPGPETCNGIDDNCNGTVDEGFPVGTTCTNGSGPCQTSGVYVCSANVAVCNAVVGTGSMETCDGIDNDCDNVIDNVAGVGDTCDSDGVGACATKGTKVCGDGVLECNAVQGMPTAEICDGIDNNCDNTVDEDPACVVCIDFSNVPVQNLMPVGGGDAEFNGNGPSVKVTAAFAWSSPATTVTATVCVEMTETTGDFTHGQRCVMTQSLPAPMNGTITALVSQPTFEVQYTDSDTADDDAILESTFLNSNPVVLGVTCTGDTASDDVCGFAPPVCSGCEVALDCVEVRVAPP